MVEANYNGVKVDFTDCEYARLKAIKNDPGWKPNHRKQPIGYAKMRTGLTLPPLLADRAKVYAKDRGISFAVLVENLLSVIVD